MSKCGWAWSSYCVLECTLTFSLLYFFFPYHHYFILFYFIFFDLILVSPCSILLSNCFISLILRELNPSPSKCLQVKKKIIISSLLWFIDLRLMEMHSYKQKQKKYSHKIIIFFVVLSTPNLCSLVIPTKIHYQWYVL